MQRAAAAGGQAGDCPRMRLSARPPSVARRAASCAFASTHTGADAISAPSAAHAIQRSPSRVRVLTSRRVCIARPPLPAPAAPIWAATSSAGRNHPPPGNHSPPAVTSQPACRPASVRGRYADVLRREPEHSRYACHTRFFRRAPRELQHAAALPLEPVACGLECAPTIERVEKPGAGKPREHAVVACDEWMESTGR